MKRKAVLTSTLAIGGAALCAEMAGCQSAPHEARDQAVALALLGPIPEHEIEPADASPVSFRLGAGDALGQDIFVVYVASILAQQGPVYATGEDEAPSD